MKVENLSDILEIAVRIERDGVELYRRLYEKSVSPQAREIFSSLAAEEERHLGAFRQMLERVATYTPRYSYPGEYGMFIEGVAARVIERAQITSQFEATDDVAALMDAALSLESETLLFYLDCGQHAQDEQLKRGIQTIIDEEKQHWVRLLKLKRRLCADSAKKNKAH